MAKAKKVSVISQECLDIYDKLIASVPGQERKGDTVPYTSHNGHMYSMLSGDFQLALRLPKETIDEFLTKYSTQLNVAYGIVRKEYADVPPALFSDIKKLSPWFVRSFEYVAGLKPKPTTRKK